MSEATTYLVHIDDGDHQSQLGSYESIEEAKKCFDDYIASGPEDGIEEIELGFYKGEDWEETYYHSFTEDSE